MPTASQCLILMTDEECAERMSLRRYSGVSSNACVPKRIFVKEKEHINYESRQIVNDRFPVLSNSKEGLNSKHNQPSANEYKVAIPYGYADGYSSKQKINSGNLGIGDKARKQTSYFEDQANTKSYYPDSTVTSSSCTLQSQQTEQMTKAVPQQYGIDERSYERLEELGFRRRQKNRPVSVRKLDVNDNQLLTGIMKDAKFVPAPPGHKPVPINSLQTPLDRPGGDNFSTGIRNGNLRNQSKPQTKPLSLLDEIKQKVDYGNRVLPAMHMRKTLPEANPTAVCFSIAANKDLSHGDVKQMVQSQTGYQVKSLQYDPVSVRAGSDIGSRWIVNFGSRDICSEVIRGGLELDGEKIVVKSLDEIHLFEYTAFLAKYEEEKKKSLRCRSRGIDKKRGRSRHDW